MNSDENDINDLSSLLICYTYFNMFMTINQFELCVRELFIMEFYG